MARARTLSRPPRGKSPMVRSLTSVIGKRSLRAPSPGARRGTTRTQSPAVKRVVVKDHEMVRSDESSVEARLAALKSQQCLDHTFLSQMADAMRLLGSGLENERDKRIRDDADATQMNLNLRQEIYGIRDKLNQDVQANVATVVGAFFQDGPG